MFPLLAAFEHRYRRDHAREHAILLDHRGSLVVERTGDADSVQFTPDELNRACMGYLSHIHPHAKPPSSADLSVAAENGLLLRAVGNVPGTGEKFDYTVKMPVPSRQLAEAILASFDQEVAAATKELTRQPYDQATLEREARHLAIIRLAKRYGFAYERVHRGASVSETVRHEAARLSVLSGLEDALYLGVFKPLHDSLSRVLARNSLSDGTLDIASLERVRQESGRLIQRALLGAPAQDDTISPYQQVGGKVVPRSVYFKAVFGSMVEAAKAAVERHADMMRRYLPEDLRRAFEFATVSPFEGTLGEDPQYDPLHLWVGPDGKQLSDRIWNVAGDMRRQLDNYLTEAIANRRSVGQMTAELERFLMPGKGTYEAYRLARTEVAAAYARADFAAAQGNPFVETYQPFTAPKHQCCDECDLIVAQGPYKKDDSTHLPPYHPLCICGVLWNVVQDVKKVVEGLYQKLKEAIAEGRQAFVDIVGPLSRRFIEILFGGKI